VVGDDTFHSGVTGLRRRALALDTKFGGPFFTENRMIKTWFNKHHYHNQRKLLPRTSFIMTL